jgi:YVTN family beta-propeller protein
MLGILLAVFILVLLTYASAGASSSDLSCQTIETKSVSPNKYNETDNEPNLFELNGVGQHKDVCISYSTTSFSSVPIFHYKDSKGDYNFMGNDEIRTQKTEIGTMVTVTLEYAPDLYVETLTLLVPDINLHGSPREFKTIAIRTTSKTNFAGESAVEGAVQSYEVIDLNGTAKHVYSWGAAITPDGTKVYVTNSGTADNPGNTVSVIDTATNNVTATLSVGTLPWEVAITQDVEQRYT